MGESLRVDTIPLFADSFVVGDSGLGILGSDVPCGVVGVVNPPFCDDLLHPNKEYAGVVTTWPTSGDLFVAEDSSFTYSNPIDGAYYYEYQLVEEGVEIGVPSRVDLVIGTVYAVGTGAGTLSAITGDALGIVDYSGTTTGDGAGILAAITATAVGATVAAPISGTAAGTLASITAAATGLNNYVGNTGVASGILGSITAVSVGSTSGYPISGIGAGVLAPIHASAQESEQLWTEVTPISTTWVRIK